jgi:hypothetical protein
MATIHDDPVGEVLLGVGEGIEPGIVDDVGDRVVARDPLAVAKVPIENSGEPLLSARYSRIAPDSKTTTSSSTRAGILPFGFLARNSGDFCSFSPRLMR